MGSWDAGVEYALPEAQGLSIFPKKTASAASVVSKGLTFIHLADTELPTPEVGERVPGERTR